MTFSYPKRTALLWQIRISAISALLCAVTVRLSVVIGLCLIAPICLAVIFIYLPLYFKGCTVTITECAVCVSRGVIIKTTHIMPFPRLIFAESVTTPLAASMRLKGVVLRASRAFIVIPEMKSADADFLLCNLKVKPND